MARLDRHFGTDASVEPALAARIGAYLRAHAGAARRFGSASRISETAWFREEHDDVARATWKAPAVRSAANCSACHTQAARGDFSERHLTLPMETRR